MAHVIPSPDPQSLLPPLLACLPTSFASSKPPPALLELLSPILRQRLTIFTSTGSSHDNWLRLLCWDSSKGETLKETIENANFEPHPSSGELEVGDIERLSYKRFDAETLKAQIPLNDWDLTALYLWCTGSEEGNAWRLTELLPYDSDLCQDQSWSTTPTQANEQATSQLSSLGNQPSYTKGRALSVPGQDDDDDDYWAQYDKTPHNGTPARKGSVNPGAGSTEADYYAQYADVQPAMDSYDPDEHHEELGDSTLGRDSMPEPVTNSLHLQQQQSAVEESKQPTYDTRRLQIPEDEDVVHINHPVPSSPTSRAGSDTISRLEATADRYSASEIAIKQHISYSVKSMYRLAKGAGMGRQEFEDMVQRELETLSLLDRED
ncbi:hypothetical protein PMZ80_006800 [Knufia obscura]|uniref:Uncharacterized protein n=2 Tax=Knufia TaxID=430999 RepID=A0AAN8EF14_9EURO|nr:hypothetical protein PMZ80_006800 [Knufia obscura]KAK5948120.1 hypothetical protein OHC33_010868 [Knufia fluminis]